MELSFNECILFEFLPKFPLILEFVPQTTPIFKIKCLSDDNPSKEVLMSWNGDTNDGQTIQMNGLFANKLGFSHKQQVLATYVPNPESEGIRNGIKCHLKPITENDWEILSINSSFIESNLLNQIRVLSSDQIIPVWITNQSNVCLFVKSFNLIPSKSKAIILNTLTEVVVCPPNSAEPITETNSSSSEGNQTQSQINEQKTEQNSSGDQWSISSVFGFVKNFIPSNNTNEVKDINPNKSQKSLDRIQLKTNECFNEVLRVITFFSENENIDKYSVNTVFVSEDIFNECEDNYFVSKLTNYLSPIERKRENQKNEKKEEKNDESKEIKTISKQLSELCFKETVVVVCGHKECPDSSIFICDSLRRQMGLSITSRVYLSHCNESSIPLITDLILCPIAVSPKSSKVSDDLIRSELIGIIDKTLTSILFLNNGSLIRLCDTDFFTFNKNDSIYGITEKSLKQLSIEICEPVMHIQKPFSDIPLPVRSVKTIDQKLRSCLNTQFKEKPFVTFDILFKKCLNFLNLNLSLNELSIYLRNISTVKSASILITGAKGSGKSHLVNALIGRYVGFPHFVFVEYIDCHSLKGKRIETIQKNWENSLAECLHRQPSILIFDNLDAIASIPSKPGQEMSAEAVYSERVALLFLQLIEKCNRKDISFGDRIAVMATSRSKQCLQTALMQTRGRHAFQDIIEIPSPDLKQRIDIITKLLSHRIGVENIESHLRFDLKEIAIKTKGYTPLDLTALVDRALHNSYLVSKTNVSQNLVITEDNFRAAFDGFCPLNLRGLDLELKSNRRLSEVGGLAQVKKCLIETIQWSIKYPVLFSKLPLKAQSCIMLFGAPGTGKTLMVEAVANECDINFIGIKGPELLSKYVGQSEQSVRDVFSRAQAAKPCILFFDEFDALAPRRGHDSTGVTDRVVNQLLTQMDGFEEMGSGVYVLSATSRPDLIDPALLRPGRFDKCLHCPLPNEEERLEILNALSTKLVFSPDVDLKAISQQTDYFSGADLQAVLYSAQLDALHNSLNESKKGLKKQSKDSTEQSLENIASYMPSVEKGFIRDLNSGERQKLINEIEIYSPNALYTSDTNSSDVCPPKRLSSNNLIAIQQQNLLTALNATKPSISEFERKKFDKM